MKGGKHQSVAFCTPPTGDLARNPGLCLDWESNQRCCHPHRATAVRAVWVLILVCSLRLSSVRLSLLIRVGSAFPSGVITEVFGFTLVCVSSCCLLYSWPVYFMFHFPSSLWISQIFINVPFPHLHVSSFFCQLNKGYIRSYDMHFWLTTF